MPQFAYATVVSTPPDAAHAIALAHSLRRHGSRVPLVVLHPANLDGEALQALNGEAEALNLTTAVADGPSGGSAGGEDAHDDDRGNDGEAEAGPAGDGGEAAGEEDGAPPPPQQLAVFGPALWAHETVCAVAPRSVVVRRGMDLVFAAPLPTGDWLGAVPLCGCPSPPLGRGSPGAAGPGKGAGKMRASSVGSAAECPYAQEAGDGSSVGGSPVLVERAPPSPASPLSPRGLMTPSRALSFSALASQLPAPGATPSSAVPSPAGTGARIDPRLLLFCPDERLRDRVLAAAGAARVRREAAAASSSDRSSSSSSASHAARQPPPPDDGAVATDELDRASRILHAAFPARWAPLPATYLASRALRTNHPALDGGGGRRGGGGLRIACVHCETGQPDAPPSSEKNEAVAGEEAAGEAGGGADDLAAALAAWRAERLAAGGEGAHEAVERVDRLVLPAPGQRRGVATGVGEALPEPLTGSWQIPAELEARAVGALAF
jgi:hypothetical protein